MTFSIKSAVMLFTLCFLTLGVYAEDPQVRFDIAIQKSIPASNIVLHYSIQKKASNLEIANQALQEALKKIQTTSLANGVSTANIRVDHTYAAPSQWVFGKDYIVNASAAITVKDMATYPTLAKLLTQLDPDIQFETISFDYAKDNPLWQPLLEEASKEAKNRKADYEKLFGVKLRLNTLREYRSAPENYTPGPFMMKRTLMASAEAAPASDLLPSQIYRLNLEVGYVIETPAPEPKKTSQIENLLKQTKILH